MEAQDGALILIYEPDCDTSYVYTNTIITEVDDNDDHVSVFNQIYFGSGNKLALLVIAGFNPSGIVIEGDAGNDGYIGIAEAVMALGKAAAIPSN